MSLRLLGICLRYFQVWTVSSTSLNQRTRDLIIYEAGALFSSSTKMFLLGFLVSSPVLGGIFLPPSQPGLVACVNGPQQNGFSEVTIASQFQGPSAPLGRERDGWFLETDFPLGPIACRWVHVCH